MLLWIDFKADETEKKKTEELSQIIFSIILMIIFMLEHQFVIVGVERGGEKGGEREIFRQGEEIGIGSSGVATCLCPTVGNIVGHGQVFVLTHIFKTITKVSWGL